MDEHSTTINFQKESKNRVSISGTIDSDINIKNTSNNLQLASLQLKVTKAIKSKDSEELKQRFSWFSVVAYDAENVEMLSKMQKGDEILVRGNLNVRVWTDPNNPEQKNKKTEIVIEDISPIDIASGNKSCINNIIIEGRIDSDINIKNTSNNLQLANLQLKVTKLIKTKETEEYKLIPFWFSLTSYSGSNIEMLSKMQKGDEILVQGNLNVRVWTDPNNPEQKNKKNEIVIENITPLKSDGTDDSYANTSEDSFSDDSMPF